MKLRFTYYGGEVSALRACMILAQALERNFEGVRERLITLNGNPDEEPPEELNNPMELYASFVGGVCMLQDISVMTPDNLETFSAFATAIRVITENELEVEGSFEGH